MKARVNAALQRYATRDDDAEPPTEVANKNLLTLARAAKAMSMCATLHFGEDRELMFDLDAALDAFDWGDE